MNNLHNYDKKIALINDFTGFGRCSLQVSVPVISAMKIQCCAIPTSIFSNHTAFDSYYYNDYTDQMKPYIHEWKKLGLKFSGIYTGFLGSEKQIDIVSDFINDFKTKDTLVIIDPVMGDNGIPYATYNQNMCSRMKQLVKYADILTPNLTEACILTDTSYKSSGMKVSEIKEIARKLSSLGPEKIVITGITQGQYVANYCVDSQSGHFIRTHKIGCSRAGTGDIFASIIAADAVNGIDFNISVKKASNFIKKCITASNEMGIPDTDGVCFEQFLHSLK